MMDGDGPVFTRMVVVKSCHLLQAPPSLDENNFPSLATSPGHSPRAAANGPASADSPAPEATAVGESDDTESPKAAEKPRVVAKLPSVWGSVEGSAHKATSPEKKSSSTGWISKGDSMSSQQKAQAANSKLQPSAASFKSRNKSTSKVPWVETGLSCLLGTVLALTTPWPDKVLICQLEGNKHPSHSCKGWHVIVLSGVDHTNTPYWWCASAKTHSLVYGATQGCTD
jgi:hypothetical protein